MPESSPVHAHRSCPQCGRPLHRIRRRPLDRLASLVVPRHRYSCSDCGWTGLLRPSGRGSSRHRSSRGRERTLSVVNALLVVGVAAVIVLLVTLGIVVAISTP